MRLLAAADWFSMFAAERIWSPYFSETRPMAPALLGLVFGFNIKPIHSAVDMGNQSPAACELFCIQCERLTIPIVRAYASLPEKMNKNHTFIKKKKKKSNGNNFFGVC